MVGEEGEGEKEGEEQERREGGGRRGEGVGRGGDGGYAHTSTQVHTVIRTPTQRYLSQQASACTPNYVPTSCLSTLEAPTIPCTYMCTCKLG